MAVSIMRPEQQESGFDKFLRRAAGVAGLANTGINTYAGIKDIRAKNLAKEDESAGVRSANAFDPKDWVQAQPGEEGAETFKIREGDNVVERAYKKRMAEAKAINPLEQKKLEAEINKLNAEAKKAGSEASPDGKKYAQNEYQAAGFATRAEQAQSAFDDLVKTGYNPSGFWESIGASKFNPDYSTPESAKLYQQAKDDFVSAVLRKESGASISPAERLAEERKYFPSPGDSEKVKQQKSASRSAAIATLQSEASGALNRVQGRLAGGGLSELIRSPGKNAQYTNMSDGLDKLSDEELSKLYTQTVKNSPTMKGR